MNIKRGLATLAIAALSLTSLAACGSDTAQDEEKPDSLSFWYYEEDDAGQTQAWRRAAKAFEKETGVKINFERKSFTQIAQNGSQFLNSDEAPDLMESNRGNGSAGVLSTMGLLTDLGDYVKQYGWDKKVTGANAAVAKYDENGIMDGDTWYGMTSYAEFQRVYYNKDLFAKYNIKIPTTYDEFVGLPEVRGRRRDPDCSRRAGIRRDVAVVAARFQECRLQVHRQLAAVQG